jgi:hypothetical protein
MSRQHNEIFSGCVLVSGPVILGPTTVGVGRTC